MKLCNLYKGSAIYKIQNIKTSDFYIGSAVNLHARIHTHVSTLNNNTSGCIHLQHAWNKYEGQFNIEILELVQDKNNLIEREQFYIDMLKPKYNINPTAGSRLGAKVSKESKDRMRQAKLINPTKHWKGKQLSEEHRLNLSISHKGKKPWNIGISQSDETKLKNSLAHIGRKTGPRDQATCDAIRDANSKAVYQYDINGVLINQWSSFTIAAQALNIHRTSISCCVSGRSKTAGGYIWKKEKI